MTDQQINNPHDKFFKEVFSRIAVILSFIENYLLNRVHLKLDLRNLQPFKNDSVNSHYREFFSDLVFCTRDENTSIPVYLLFEHKSYTDPETVMQLKRYMDVIEEDFCKEKPSTYKYVNIIPIVIYHGTDDWNISQSVIPLYPPLENAVPYIPKFKYELFDISHMPDEKIIGSPLLKVVLLLMKYIQSNELKQKIDDILVILKEIDDPEIATFLEVFSLYIENAAPKDLRRGLLEKIRETLNAGGNNMSAVTEYFREEGRKEGLEKGLKDGRAEGLQKGREEGIGIGIKKEKEQLSLIHI